MIDLAGEVYLHFVQSIFSRDSYFACTPL